MLVTLQSSCTMPGSVFASNCYHRGGSRARSLYAAPPQPPPPPPPRVLKHSGAGSATNKCL